MQGEQKPRPFSEYQTRSNAVLQEGDKFRGAVSCKYVSTSGQDSEYFDFTCDELRDTSQQALFDATDLHHYLETTLPPTIALNGGYIYSLPTAKEHARAKEWLGTHDHVAAEFEKEFPGARPATSGPIGGSSFAP